MRPSAGYILLPVVLLISLVAVTAYMLNNVSILETNISVSSVEAERASYVASAGLQHALWQVEQAGCGPYTDIVAEAFAGDSYSATITTNNVGGTITTITVPVIADAYIQQDNSTANFGSAAELQLGGSLLGGNYKRPVYRFDIENAGIAPGATIVSAVAKFFVTGFDHTYPVTVHQVTATWDEATVNWDNIFMDLNISPVGSIPSGTPVGQFADVNMTALVQSWVNGAEPNFGVTLAPSILNSSQTSSYTSKEYGTVSQRPYLEIKISDGSLANRASINTTGALANGVTHSLARADIPLYQPSSTVVLQPDATQGKDNWLYEWKSGWNYGADNEVWVENRYANSIANSLFEFELAGFPAGVKVLSASLALHQNTPSLNGGTIGVHRMNAPWVEGTSTGGSGTSNWSEKDSGVFWVSVGGDYDSTVVSNTVVIPSTIGWFEWDITSLVQGWMDGSYENYGLALVAEVFGTAAHFDSSDHADPTLRPKLTITFACECGITCQVPQGSGNVLLVVGDDITLNPADTKKKALIEAWGYTVSLIDDAASQTTFDTALGNNDVVYISDTADDATLADKLANTDKGVLNEDAGQNANLGLSSGGSHVVSQTMEIVDNSHYITALFPSGVLPVNRAPMEGLVVSGAPAPDLQTLGKLTASSSLAFVEVGGALGGDKAGVNATGRRVMLPIGSVSKFNWDYLNNNGRLIVQRALQWGSGNTSGAPAAGPLAHWKLDDGTGTTAIDSEGGHDGTLLNGPAWVGGQIGDALHFDGSNDRVDAGTFDVNGSGLTLMGWFNADALPDTTDPRIISKASSTAEADAWWQLSILTSGTSRNIRLRTKAGGTTSTLIDSSTNLNTGEWYFAVGTYDAVTGEMKLYLNGTEVASQSHPVGGAIDTNAAVPVAIGANGSSEQFFDGRLDDVRVYDRALSATEIFDLFTEGGGGAATGPLAHWKLDDGTGTTAIDSEGGHDGTLLNGPAWVGGQIGDALHFDGSNDRVDAGTFDVNGSGLTLMGWFNADALPDITDPRIISKASSTAEADAWWQLSILTSGTSRNIRLRTKAGGTTSTLIDSSTNLNTGEWYFAVGTYDAVTGEMKLYLNGTEVASQSHPVGGAIDTNAAVPVAIGANGSSEQFFDGRLDDVRVYDRALSATEIFDLFTDGGGGGGGGGGGEPPPTAGVAFEEFTEAKLGSNGKSFSIAKPAGVTIDDLLIAVVATDGIQESAMSAPSGWTLINHGVQSEQVSMDVWWKLAGSSEPAGYNFSWAEDQEAYGMVMRFTGHDPVDPINTSSNTGGRSSSPNSPVVTTSVADTMILRIGGFDDDDITVDDPGLAGHTTITMDKSSNGSGTVSAAAGYVTQASAGDSGTANFSLTRSEQYRAVTIGIAPAP